jgi:alkylhydroperoxidase/carboxymuconolactone decarboxylase family protein YurZ
LPKEGQTIMSQRVSPLDPAQALERLEAVKQKRGYLLPHHGLLALTDPQLLEGYDACYTALTLGQRVLTERDKEFVWLGILVVREEFLATQHVNKFLAAGGRQEEVALAVRLAAYAQGVSAFDFADRYWTPIVPELGAKQQYMDGLSAVCAGVTLERPELLHLAMIAIHTSIRNWAALQWHISEAYEAGLPEPELAEALSYSMFTGSIPNFIEGCGVWRDMILNGEVAASEPFQLWASVDQDGPKASPE